MYTTLGQGQEMTLTFNTHIPSCAPTNFQVTGCYTFLKVHCFHFSHRNAYVTKFDLGVNQVKVNPGSSFVQTMMGWSSRCYIPSFVKIGPPVPEKKIFKGFYHIWAWRPSWSCDLDHFYKLSFPLPKEAPHKIWL